MIKPAVTTIFAEKKSDASVRDQLNFQTPATEIMEKIVDLHNDLFFFIIVIVLFVS
jgi:heme/copper-type cytochrome/quinol oxidase subunit 2